MKNLIAISAVALTAPTALAGVVATNVFSGVGPPLGWVDGFSAQYAGADYYTDTFHNATMSGANIVGGHGWGAWTMESVNVTSTLSLTGSGDGTSIVSTANSPANDNYISFTFATSGGPAGGLYGIGILFTATSIAVDGPAPFVSANFGSGNSNTWNTFTVAPGINFIGFYSDNSAAVQTLSLGFGNGTLITILELEYGLVPAPGAIALVGVAGLVGSRRRRA